MNSFKTLNNAEYKIIDDSIVIKAGEKTDYFVNPETFEVLANAPFVYKEVSRDFVIKAEVSHSFTSTYDACVLFAYNNEKEWAKACFEKSDFNTHAVVSVMTNKCSDDANGVNVEGNTVWLKMVRKNNVFGIYYSYDDKEYFMARLSRIEMPETIKVGFLAQSPLGAGTTCTFKKYSINNITVSNIRTGI